MRHRATALKHGPLLPASISSDVRPAAIAAGQRGFSCQQDFCCGPFNCIASPVAHLPSLPPLTWLAAVRGKRGDDLRQGSKQCPELLVQRTSRGCSTCCPLGSLEATSDGGPLVGIPHWGTSCCGRHHSSRFLLLMSQENAGMQPGRQACSQASRQAGWHAGRQAGNCCSALLCLSVRWGSEWALGSYPLSIKTFHLTSCSLQNNS